MNNKLVVNLFAIFRKENCNRLTHQFQGQSFLLQLVNDIGNEPNCWLNICKENDWLGEIDFKDEKYTIRVNQSTDEKYLFRLIQSVLTVYGKRTKNNSIAEGSEKDLQKSSGVPEESLPLDSSDKKESQEEADPQGSTEENSSSSKKDDECSLSSPEKENGGDSSSEKENEGSFQEGSSPCGATESSCETASSDNDSRESGYPDSSNTSIDGQKMEKVSEENNCLKDSCDDRRASFDCHKRYTPTVNRHENNSYGGGGSQMEVVRTSSDWRITRCAEQLLSGGGVRKIQGDDHYWAPLVAKSLIKHNIPALSRAKYKREPEKVYFILDTSGSMYSLSELVMRVLNSLISSNKVVVWSGSEAHPNCKHRKNNSYDCIIEYNHSFNKDFIKFIEVARPQFGATMIFYGDLWGCHIEVDPELKRLVQRFNCYWFWNLDNHSRIDNRNDINRAIAVGFNIKKGIDDISKFIYALKSIK